MEQELQHADLTHLIETRNWSELRDVVSQWSAPEIADLLRTLNKSDHVFLFRALPREVAAEAFSHLNSESADALLRDLTDDETRELLSKLPPDDRTHILEELPGQVTQRILKLLSHEDLKEARFLLGYPEESAGRLMTPDYVALRAHWTVGETLEYIRKYGVDSETINRVYVTDENGRLQDDIELRKLILSDPARRVETIMDRSFVSVSAFADREEAVRLIRKYDLVALPVLDSTGVLVGIVTVDDLLDVAEAEATEDFHKVGSVGPIQMSLREAGIGYLYRRRIGWLAVLIVFNLFSGAGIAYFEETIAATLPLIVFLPLLIGSSGNAGSQAATLMIRAMATGDVHGRHWFELAGKELGVAGALGLTMALAASGVGFYRGGSDVGTVVALTMVIVVVVGSLIGMSLPFLLERAGFDPATASAPLVTSIADIMGVLVYFSIASWYL